jgi:hypothetical protein
MAGFGDPQGERRLAGLPWAEQGDGGLEFARMLGEATLQIPAARSIRPLGFVYISPPFSTVCFNCFTGTASASFGASHGGIDGGGGGEKRVESVSC